MSIKVLTVIVPTYNMEDYLDKCLTSLVIGEPDSDIMCCLDVIVVNDGSTDRSSEIAHRYEAKYPNTFIVIDKENGNYGSCINIALPVAKGKYIKVLDADDYYDQAAFLSYINLLKEIHVDVVLTDVLNVNALGEITFSRKINSIEKEKVLPWQAIIPFSRGFMFSHHFTFCRQLLVDMQYHQTEGVFYTDVEWVIYPMTKIQTIYYLPVYLYNYFIDRNGQTMSPAVRSRSSMSSQSLIISLGNLWATYNEDEQRKEILYQAFIIQINYLYKNFALLKEYSWTVFRSLDNVLTTNLPQIIDETNKIMVGGRFYPMPIIKYWREKQYFLFILARIRYQFIGYWKKMTMR